MTTITHKCDVCGFEIKQVNDYSYPKDWQVAKTNRGEYWDICSGKCRVDFNKEFPGSPIQHQIRR